MERIIVTPAKFAQLTNGLLALSFTQEQVDHIVAESNIMVITEELLLEQGFTMEVITAIMNSIT